MIFHLLASVAVTLVAVIDPILAQEPPCPPIPELAGVVDTFEKCMCFYALLGSGLDLGNSTTFSSAFNDVSVQNFAQTGQYVGVDGISEYLSFVKGGERGFVKDYVLMGQPLFLDMTGSTMEQCVATTAERRRLSFNPLYSQDNQDMCVDVVAGSTLYYTMTRNPEAPVTIQKVNVWFPDELISETFPSVANTMATSEFVCDTIVNTCGYDTSSKKKAHKKRGKSWMKSKSKKAMKECMKTLNSMPSFGSGELSYIDGNTKGCRILHSVFANTNPNHCPHISFEADEDVNGLIKCNESKQTPLTDLFTEQQLGLFKYATSVLDLGATGIDIKLEACPEI
mmetsp:Transcript_3826/g.6863  ORF Transcript_3826/g.6863 Transcript_3826/m.6863 type:complete len:339 (+) Transcript_3826:89-1105(+)